MSTFRTNQSCVSGFAAASSYRPARRRRLLRAAFAAAAILVTTGIARAETVLVEAGKTMTWRANSSDPGIGTSWTAEGFNAGAWTAGSYGVGYETGTGAAALLATTVPGATNSVYTRTTFTIADVSAVTNLLVGADYDDGYAAWINGVEVFRSPQLPAGALAWNTPAALHESSNAATPNYGTLADVSAKAIPALHNGTNVLAIGVWNSTLPSSDLVLVPKLTINAGASVSRGPYLQLGTASGIVVRWRTTVATDGCVRYGSAPGNLTQIACVPGTVSEHVVPVSGLSANTAYFYSVGTTTAELAGNSSSYTFVTSPPAGTSRPTRVWALGDSGNANANARAVRDAYFNFTGATPTDLWLMLGDNAYTSGTDSEFQAAVFDTYPTMLRRSVLWPTLGNHDGISADSTSQSGPYYDIFTLPKAGEAGGFASGTEAYYSFDYGDIHFICLDSYETDRSMTGGMAQWLAADLADTTATWVIAFFHHPPYSKGSHDSDVDIEMIEMRENAVRLLEQGGVDLVLTGHSHSYERSFLIDGHYGSSATFTDSMKKDGGSGREDGTGAYEKAGGGPQARQGAVYAVAGSSSETVSAPLNHPAMYIGLVTLGSLVLDFDGPRLDVQFLDSTGTTRDYFTMVKTVPAVCGNGIIESGESCDGASLGGATCGGCGGTPACTASCTLSFAGCTNGICGAGETCGSCPADCTGSGATCGNGICEAGDGENCLTCAADCNGKQGGKPAGRFCCGAPGGAGPVGCSLSQCGSCVTTSAASCCGDGLCGGNENTTSCSRDCPAAPVCGDQACNGTENSCTCAGDCGAPPLTETSCSDGIDNDCDGATDCSDTAQCAASPSCASCSAAGSSCTTGASCCSGQCKGKAGAKTCR